MDLTSLTGKATSVLVLSSSIETGQNSICADLLTAGPAPNVLWIAFGGQPDARIARFREHADGPPAQSAVVSVSENGPSPDPGSLPFDPRIETVSTPTDLTGVGIRITDCLRDWEDDDNPTRVCLDSLTSLLLYTDFRTAYEFLHVVVGRAYELDASIHLHLDPGAHDERTIESVATLCDAVVSVTDDGIDVRAREQ